ncbi:ROK family protein [Metabacillus idriensis]|uniref:ROK family protein n=1 Tax=Metabacillus idriensis TaxID=324768 RepID=UPI003D2C20F6
MERHLLGIDLGGTNLRAALVTAAGEILEEHIVPTETEKGPEHIIQNMANLCENFMPLYQIDAIGIGAPGPLNSKQGLILSPPNLPGWDNVPIVMMLEKLLNKKAVLDNDANAAALAEAMIGSGKDEESIFYMTVSTGVGGGYIYQKQIIQGAHSCAGEIGNMIIDREGPAHPKLNIGSLESLSSGTALKAAGRDKLGLKGHAGELFLLAMDGHQEAIVIVDNVLNHLAKGIANIVHTVDPHMIVLGGGVMQSKEYIMPILHKKVNDYLYPELRHQVKIKCASLGTKAGVIGAALLTQRFNAAVRR